MFKIRLKLIVDRDFFGYLVNQSNSTQSGIKSGSYDMTHIISILTFYSSLPVLAIEPESI